MEKYNQRSIVGYYYYSLESRKKHSGNDPVGNENRRTRAVNLGNTARW